MRKDCMSYTKKKQAQKRQYFGTDGIRGRVGSGPITPDFILKLGWAAGKTFAGIGANRVIIGKDTRVSGYMFESALEAGLSAAGVDVWLLGPMPTPAVAYLTRTFNAAAGIMITASHNPYYDNGIKFFSNQGIKIDDAFEINIEQELENKLTVVEPARLGKAFRVKDAAGRYIEYCKGTAPKIDLSGLKLVIDAAHGANYQVGFAVFSELGATVIMLGNNPDGFNINREVGSTCLAALAQEVVKQKADFGFAFDGDGDRVIMVDHEGMRVDGDQLLYIIAKNHQRTSKLSGGVIGTLMTNLGMEHALNRLGIPFFRAAVGDRYVNESLRSKGWALGGEASGHIICRQVSTTGDGIVAALQILLAVTDTGLTLKELASDIETYPQMIINVPFTGKIDPTKLPQVQSVLEESKKHMGDKGRIVIRPSGTEPVIRVMVEGENETDVQHHCRSIADAVAHADS